MNRKIVVYLPQLTGDHRRGIQETADRLGFRVCFPQTLEEALPLAEDAEIIFSQTPALTGTAGVLKWFCTASAGVDAFLKPGVLKDDSVILTNSSGAYGTTISEHVVMVTIALMRRELEYREHVNRREWIRSLKVRSIHGSRITVLGTGDLGWEIAVRMRGFSPACITGVNRSGRSVEGFDRILKVEDLDTVLPETDLLIITLPGTRETEHLMDRKRLLLLPEDAFLVNVGRGSCVDEKALEELMRAGHLAGAGLDVFEQEPLSPDSSIWTCPRVWITPHTAGNMTLDYTLDRIAAMFIENLECYAESRPMKRVVSRTSGY